MGAKVTWKGEGLRFEGASDKGLTVNMASALDEGTGGEGFRPMEMMAIGLAGCTAMDVISILQKKRQPVKEFAVTVETMNANTHPHVWTSVAIKYILTGSGIERAAVERAIKLSRDKYCPAQAMIRKSVEISLSFEIIEG